MFVHASTSEGPTVLRAPRIPENIMFDIAQRTGEVFTNGYGDPRVSPITKRDIAAQFALPKHIGRNMAPVLPFVDEDMEGHIRVYSTQQRLSMARDISHAWGDPTTDMSLEARKSFARLLQGTRELIENERVIPDLVGHGNVILTDDNRVVLVDINNIRPYLGETEWSRQEMTQELWKAMINREGGELLRNFLAPGYVDELGQPIGDASLYQLRRWELALAKHRDATQAEARDTDTVKNDPLYTVIDGERNMWRDRVLTFMISGDIKVPRS